MALAGRGVRVCVRERQREGEERRRWRRNQSLAGVSLYLRKTESTKEVGRKEERGESVIGRYARGMSQR